MTVLRNLGDIYRQKGDKVKAIEYYQKLLALKTTDEKAKKAIEELIVKVE